MLRVAYISEFLKSFFFVFSRLTWQLINGRCNVGFIINANSLRKYSKSSVVNFLVTTPITVTMASARLREYTNRNEIPNGTENSRNFQISGKKDSLLSLVVQNFSKKKFSKIAVPFDSVLNFPKI